MGTNPIGRQPTKRINMYKDHEFVIGKLILGVNETLESYAVLGGAGLYATPAECAEECHWLNFQLKGMMDDGSNRGLNIDLQQGVDGTAHPRGANFRAANLTLVGSQSIIGSANEVRFGAVKPVANNDFNTIGVGVSAQFTIPNRTLTGGTPAAIMGTMHCSGASSVLSCTNPSLLWLRVTGHATGAAKIVSALFVDAPDCEGNKAAATLVCTQDTIGTDNTKGLQVNVNGTQYWIQLHAI